MYRGEKDMERKHRNAFIDYIKYICALEVVWMHTVNISELSGSLLNNIIMKAASILPPVELFFVFSSFFFFKRKPNVNSVVNWAKKLYITYIFYSLFYLKQITEHFHGRSTLLNIVSLVRQFFFTGYGIMGWFVPALLWGVIITFLLSKLNGGKKHFSRIIIFIVSILCMAGSSFYNVIPHNPMYYFNELFEGIGVLRGIIYVYIGYELSEVEISRHINKKEIIRCAVTWVVMQCMIVIVNQNEWGLNTRGLISKFLYVAFLSAIIFKIMLCSEAHFKKSTDLGKISAFIYYIHSFLINITPFITNAILQWGVVVLVSTILGKIIVYGEIKICKLLV